MLFIKGYGNRAIKVLKAAEMPLDIENVRRRAGIRNWQTTKALLFELLAKGSVSAIKTSKSWVFWIEGAAWLNSCREPYKPSIGSDRGCLPLRVLRETDSSSRKRGHARWTRARLNEKGLCQLKS